MTKLTEYLFGKKNKLKAKDFRTEEQKMLQSLINEALTKGSGPLADLFGFDEEAFKSGVEEPALKNFMENILPQLQESFIAGNAVGGSGMQRAQGKAATDLQSKLAELRYGAMNQANQNKLQGLGLINSAQGQTPYVKEGQMGFVPSFLTGLSGAAGKGVGKGLENSISNLMSGNATPTQVG